MDKDSEKFYYLRNENNVPLVTVCLIKRNSDFGKGIKLCSKDDVVDKKYGRVKAKNMALKALGTQTTSEPIVRVEAGKVLNRVANWDCDEFISITENPNKSLFNPELTEYEKKLFIKRNKK